jgi:hypothetical protein
MGACAMYTAIPDTRFVEDVLACFDPDSRVETANIAARGWQRFGLGRLAVMALAEAFTPASHRELVRALRGRGEYGAFTPARAQHTCLPGCEVVAPRWPRSAALATIVGCPPARYYGWPRRSAGGVAIIEREIVGAGLDELRARDPSAIPSDDLLGTRAVAQMLIEWLTAAHARGDHVVLHWELG